MAATDAPLPSATPWSLQAAPPPMPIGQVPELVIWPYLLQLLLFTGVMAAVALYGVRFLRGRFPNINLALGLANTTGLEVVDRVIVDPKRMVFVVKLGRRAWLLAATDDHVTTIAELDANDFGNTFSNLVEKEASPRDPR